MMIKTYLMLVFVEALDLIDDLPLTELSLLDCLSRPLKINIIKMCDCVCTMYACMRFVTSGFINFMSNIILQIDQSIFFYPLFPN